MKRIKPILVSKEAFIFCRYSIVVIIWASLILRLKWLMIVVFVFFVCSAFFKVKRSPLIWLYEKTVCKFRNTKEEWLNEYAMRFAHSAGAILSFLCLVLLYAVNDRIGWSAVFVFALLKSLSAAGFCPAGKLYECATNDSCCAFVKKHG